MTRSSPAGVALILREEGFVGHPYWPAGSIKSGVTLDFGDDLGQRKPGDTLATWAGYLDPPAIAKLQPACGVRGAGAGQLAAQLAGIVVSREAATAVFQLDTLPRYEQELVEAMPGADALPADVFGSLTDLVYNRGPAMDGDRRLEMRNIRAAVAAFAATGLNGVRAGALETVAAQLELMGNRLWPASQDGQQNPDWNRILRTRRMDEAALVRAVAVTLNPETP